VGRLIDGEWTSHDLGADAQGRFVRRAARFRGRLGEGDLPAEPGRYRLYVSAACGWSHRTMLLRALSGLEEAISLTWVKPFMGEDGWTLEDGTPLHRVYVQGAPDYTGRASVPVLFDDVAGRVALNESKDIVASLHDAMRPFMKTPVDWFPEPKRDAIEAMIDANYGPVNDGVYRCGFAASQAAHTDAATALFERMDALEAILSRQRYLLGDEITAADWYLFPTLYRFDAVYYVHFKCNLRRVADYPSLWGYTRELYQRPGVAETCRMDEIKAHYYTSHESIHPRRYVPIGPDLDFDAPHGRGA